MNRHDIHEDMAVRNDMPTAAQVVRADDHIAYYQTGNKIPSVGAPSPARIAARRSIHRKIIAMIGFTLSDNCKERRNSFKPPRPLQTYCTSAWLRTQACLNSTAA